jgi:hypothetical protein
VQGGDGDGDGERLEPSVEAEGGGCNARVFTLSKLQHKPLARKYSFVKLGSILNPYRPNS